MVELPRSRKWFESYREGELNEILTLLQELELRGFFTALAVDLQGTIVSQITGLDDAAALDRVKALKAQIALLSRIVSEADDLVKQSTSDNGEDR